MAKAQTKAQTRTQTRTEKRTPKLVVTRPASLSSLEEAILALSDKAEVTRFLYDLCTPGEIEALRQRWEVAQLLDMELPQREAAERSSASIATVTRVARFLQHERHRGYRVVLDRLHRKTKP
jgi:TrpR-related protein YerC/YecD